MSNPQVPSFVESFFHWACQTPDAPCLIVKGQTLSYAALGKRVQGVRDWIDSHVSPDERRIAIHATQDPATYAAILAILASGRAYVPLNPKSPAERNATCLKNAAVLTLLQSGQVTQLSAYLTEKGASIQVIDLDCISASQRLTPPVLVQAQDLAYLLFTSGSTGVPKGVPIHHGQLSGFMQAIASEPDFAFRQGDRFLQMFDLTFDLSIFSYAVPLSLGAACHVVGDEGVGYLEVARILQQDGITVALLVPSVLSFLENYFDEIRLPELRLSLFCGEALPANLVTQWQACCPQAQQFNVYGPTEATVFCTLHKLKFPLTEDDQHLGVVCIGRPLQGTLLSVATLADADLGSDGKGELVISGRQVTDQYWDNPEKSQACFSLDAQEVSSYRTGDIVFEKNHLFYYCGRADFQIKVDGYRIEAGEIEYFARQLPAVSNVALLGHPDANGRMRLHLFLETTECGQPGYATQCKTKLAEHLPGYMLPHAIHLLPGFPLNQNGKIDRKALLTVAHLA